MDMHPNDTQPAALHGTTREMDIASHALRGLAATHTALLDMESGMPAIPERPPPSINPLLFDLDAWASTQHPVRSQLLARAMRDEAALRATDGTLDPLAATVARRATDSFTATTPVGLHLHELMMGDQPFAGALVASADDTPGHHVLFLPGTGWETYASVDLMLETVRRRCFERGLPVDRIKGVTADAFVQAGKSEAVALRALDSRPFDVLSERMASVIRDRLMLAWDDYQLDRDLPGADVRFNDRVRGELRLSGQIDIPAILRAREHRLLDLAQEERLARTPRHVADAWRKASGALTRLAADASVLRIAAGIEPAESVIAFTDRELATRLSALGIQDAPGDLVVEIEHDTVRGSYEHLKELFGGADVVRQSLRELAWRGLSSIEPVRMRVVRGDNEAMSAMLSQPALVELVRGANLADRYRQHLEARLRGKPGGALAKATDVEVQAARMRAEAADARLAYYLPEEARSFRDDHAERGHAWVTAVLDARSAEGRATVENHAIVVKQLTYKGIPLRDVYLFGVRQPESVPTVVLYTPDAPDGHAFREFDDRQAAARGFLYAPAFREYLLDRLPSAFSERTADGTARRFAGDRLSNWVFGSPAGAGYTLTEEPFDEREAKHDFLSIGYDTMVDQAIHDTHTLQRDARRWSFSRVGTPPLQGLLADAAWETLRAPARTFQALNRFYDNVKAGDSVDAYLSFTDAYTSALDIVVPPWLAGKARSPLIRPSATRPPLAAPFELALPSPRFEARFEASGITLRGGPDAQGIYHLGGKRYIKHGQGTYGVRYDEAFDTWRLQPPGRGPLAWGPAIHYTESGAWAYHEVGLPGGAGRRLRDRFRRMLRMGDDAPAAPQGAPPAAAEQAGAAGPVAEQRLRLPAELEPRRAEFEAVFRDNPGADLMTRHGSNGSLHVRVEVPTRTAWLYEDGVATDIRSLSVAQRRQFLHELEVRFPDAAERARVLSDRGWARDGGRVPPSEPHSWRGDDGQDPAISSSTDPAEDLADALTVDQRRRWDDAVTAARAHADNAHAHAPANVGQGRGAAELLDSEDWPQRLWIYTDQIPGHRMGRNGAEVIVRSGGEGSLQVANYFQATTLPPGTPRTQLDGNLGISPAHRLGGRDPLAHWVQVDTRYMSDLFRRLNHALVRRLMPNGEYAYTLHAWGTELRLPASYTRTSSPLP